MKYLDRNTIFIICIFLFLGCSTVTRNYQFQSDTSIVVQVESENYEIVGDIVGEASSKLIIFPLYIIPLPIYFEDSKHYGRVTGHGWTSSSKEKTYQMAMYNAIEDANEKYPGGVDAIITPKSRVTISGFFPFYWKWHVIIRGKGIRLKTSN